MFLGLLAEARILPYKWEYTASLLVYPVTCGVRLWDRVCVCWRPAGSHQGDQVSALPCSELCLFPQMLLYDYAFLFP